MVADNGACVSVLSCRHYFAHVWAKQKEAKVNVARCNRCSQECVVRLMSYMNKISIPPLTSWTILGLRLRNEQLFTEELRTQGKLLSDPE